MATKKVKGSYLTPFERIGGGIFFFLYLLVMPLIMDYIFLGIERLLGTAISETSEQCIYYYVMFAVTLIIFYNFIGKNTQRFFGNLNQTLSTWGMALVAFYGLNELLFRVARLLWGSAVNLNDVSISAQIPGEPRVTVLIVVFLAPFIEEVLFRGYVFGSLRDHSRVVAYVVSCVLFAFLHVWQFAAGDLLSISRILLLVQYLVPGLVLCWSYDRCGNLWAPILTHMTVNALYVWANW